MSEVTAGNLKHRLKHRLPPAEGLQLDGFQQQAMEAIDDGHSVLVAAPTSSGKTMVAFYAVAQALASGSTVAYTAPTKALSNQKLRELSSWLGTDVGLLTGDSVVRPEAPVVVMTTEVLRNMIYAGSGFLERLGTVVLDEVHYLQDRYRGPVWEEVIISLRRGVRLVCLSATVTNATELAAWIAEVRGDCEVVVERQRPVSLADHFLVFDRNQRRVHSFETLAGGRPNPAVERFLDRAVGRDGAGGGGGRHSGGARRQGTGGNHRSNRNGAVRAARPRRTEVLYHLEACGHLPAIVFVFSRKGCDEAVDDVLAQGMVFLDSLEAKRVRRIAEAHTAGFSAADLELLGFERWVQGLEAGVAAHHAGMVPPFKEAVEECFAAGLLHAVFATETLAVGVNMPARSVVIEQLTRFGGEGFVMLTAAQYTQLTGRAGRRGIDSEGHAYTLWSPHVSFAETAHLVASNDFELDSAFAPTYNMAANLVASRSRDDAVALLRRSFAQFRADRRSSTTEGSLREARKELSEASSEVRRLGGNRRQQQRRGHDLRSVAANQARRYEQQCRHRVEALEHRLSLTKTGLARALDARVAVLGRLGLADGWELTPEGRALRRVFHESDLLCVMAVHDGVFNGLRPSELAAVVSCLSYEHRSRINPSKPTRRAPKLAARVERLVALSGVLAAAEAECRVPPSREPDSSLLEVTLLWAKGRSLAEALLGEDAAVRPTAAGAGGDRQGGQQGEQHRVRRIDGQPQNGQPQGDRGAAGPHGNRNPNRPPRRPHGRNGSLSVGELLSPGDFVRQMRQLGDLLAQVAKVAPNRDTRAAATSAVRAVLRDVVQWNPSSGSV